MEDVTKELNINNQVKNNKYIDNNDLAAMSLIENMKNHEKLSLDEEKALVIRIKEGDSSAIDELILPNMLYIISLVKMYQGKGVPLCDLIHEGYLLARGVLENDCKFDPDRSKFISYMKLIVSREIDDVIKKYRPINLTTDRGYKKKVITFINNFVEENGHYPSSEELCEKFDITEKKANKYIKSPHLKESTLNRISEIKDNLEDNGQNPDDLIQNKVLREELLKQIGKLAQLQRMVLRSFLTLVGSYKNIDDVFKNIAKDTNLPYSKIRNAYYCGLGKIKNNMKKENINSRNEFNDF